MRAPNHHQKQSMPTRKSMGRKSKVEAVPQRPYSLLKYQQQYTSTAEKVIDFFTISNIRHFVDYDSKCKSQQQVMENVLKQIRDFLQKKVSRFFEQFIMKEVNEGQDNSSIQHKFQVFDEIYFEKIIMQSMENIEFPESFEDYDPEDEILNQLQAALVKIYSQI